MIYVAAFVAMLMLDFVWAYYTKAIGNHHIWSAGITAGLIILLNSIVVLSYVGDRWAIIPAVFGAFFGTVSAMKVYERKIPERFAVYTKSWIFGKH